MKTLLMDNPEVAIGIAAVVVAIGALAVAFVGVCVALYVASLQRRQFHLSLTPHLDTRTKEVLHRPDEEFGAWVHNTGVGPARLLNLRVFVDEEPVTTESSPAYNQALRELGVNATLNHYSPGAILAPGKAWPLHTIQLTPFPNENWPTVVSGFLQGLHRLRFEFEYESLDGRRQETEVLDLVANRPRKLFEVPAAWL